MNPASQASVREGISRIRTSGWHQLFSHKGWLKLTETTLEFTPSNKHTFRPLSLSLAHIESVERSTRVSHGLLVKPTIAEPFILVFTNDRELYDWHDAIRLRTGPRISNPYSVVHAQHVTFDSKTNTLRGLPPAWEYGIETTVQGLALCKASSAPSTATAASFGSLTGSESTLIEDPASVVCFEQPADEMSMTDKIRLRSVLEDACRTQNVHPADYALAFDDLKPLSDDATVADLKGEPDQLCFVKRVYTTADDVFLLLFLKLSPDEIFLGDFAVAPNMRIFDVRQMICARRKLEVDTYDVALSGSTIPLSLNVLVWDLEGQHNLVLVKRGRTASL
uniref:CRIB domain-containing protein n=1 Tax=Mycena chlorophos TaxID=658473 RepID=A0ABQ0LUT8_MYCCL|nr:predicted protein [Mycena chlorophos]